MDDQIIYRISKEKKKKLIKIATKDGRKLSNFMRLICDKLIKKG